MQVIRAAFMAAGLVALPSVAWAQTTTTSTSGPITTTTAIATTTTTATVTRIEDLVCSEPVNNVATCVDPQGRIVTRVDDPTPPVSTTVAQPPQQPLQVQPHGDIAVPESWPTQPIAGRQLALTG